MVNFTGDSNANLFDFNGLSTGDVIDGLGGQDTLDGTSTNNDYLFDLENEIISLTDGSFAGTLRNFEVILAGNGDDILIGGTGFQLFTLDGGNGNDTISPGSAGILSGEVYAGGAGIDVLDLSNQTRGFIIDQNTNSFSIPSIFANASISGFEHFIGGSGDDFIRELTGLSTTLEGGLGDDTLAASEAGIGVNEVFDGGDGADMLDFSIRESDYNVDLGAGLFETSDSMFTATLISIEQVLAGGGDDMLRGDTGDAVNSLNGGAGNDTIMPGSDGLRNGDVFIGGVGTDVLDLTGQTEGFTIDQVSGDPNGGLIAMGAAQGTISGIEHLIGGSGNDFIREGSFSATTLEGGLGDDTLSAASTGFNVSDVFDGGAGTDMLDFSNGFRAYNVDLRDGTVGGTQVLNFEQVMAGTGDDTILAGNEDGVLYTLWGNGGDDALSGGTQDDTINGGSGQDTILGFNGNDVLSGNEGDDLVLGLLGDDQIAGNEGNDTISGEDGNDTLSGDDGNDSLGGGADADLLTGGNGEDTLSGDDGNDTLSGGGQSDVLFGGAGDDVMSGGGGNFADSIAGGDGNDQIGGGLGDDVLLGGNDDDVVSGGNGQDSIDGGEGADTLAGGGGHDTVLGGQGLDVLIGGLGVDEMMGGDDNDRINGNGAQDSLFGDAGNDTLLGGLDSDFIDGGIGNDSMRGNDGNDTLLGDSGNDTLFGDTGNDQLQGGSGNDLIIAGVGNDSLFGQSGNDTINGGGGDDTITGGIGADRFVFVADFGDNLINDFEAGADTLVLGGYTAGDITQMGVGDDLVLQIDNGVTSGTITIVNGFVFGLDVFADTLFL